MLQERSILVVSPVQGLLSSVWYVYCTFVINIYLIDSLGLLSLLKPFVWQCAVVPILPQKMWESIDSPGMVTCSL